MLLVFFRYILSSKLQTSYLEMRFGRWRSRNNNDYHLEIHAIESTEIELRVQSLQEAGIDLSDLKKLDLEDNAEESDGSEYDDVEYLEEADEEEEEFFALSELSDTHLKEAALSVAGAAAASVARKLNCVSCKNYLVKDNSKGQPFECAFNSYLQRGGLIHPKEVVEALYTTMNTLLKEIRANECSMGEFLAAESQSEFLVAATRKKTQVNTGK